MNYFLTCLLALSHSVLAQPAVYKNFEEAHWMTKLDSLQALNQNHVSPTNNLSELAVNIALRYYPELAENKIKIKYKKSVRYPVTASWSFGNFFRFKNSHTYILLLKPGSFVDHVSLNELVGVYGHEMAHFVYYKERPAINMIWWGIKYTFSKKFRMSFEREADKKTIDHKLGWQVLGMSFYMTKAEIRGYMDATYR